MLDSGYLGNPNLKKRGVNIQWTQDLINEYLKCSKDIIYFVENYVKIITEKGLIPFILRDYQRDMLLSLRNNRFTISCQSRQSGKTETIRAFSLWYILFNSNKTIALLANKAETAREILSKIQISYENLPKWLAQGILTYNKGSFVLENNSRIIASSTSSSAIRGFTITCLILDETAHVPHWDEFAASVIPTISAGNETKICMSSTPNGLNFFYKYFQDAKNGKNGYNYFFVPWQKVPGRDEKWKEAALASLGGDQQKFDVEFGCEFVGSSGTLIAGWKLKELVEETPLAESEGFYQFKPKMDNHKYCLTADVSHGKGLDYSAFHIIDITEMPYQQVCIYRNNQVTPSDYAEVIHRMAKFYNDAAILIEVNDIGAVVAEVLQWEYGADHLIHTVAKGVGPNSKKITFSGAEKADKGLRTNKLTKAVGCGILKLLIEQNQLIINDYYTIVELNTFSKKGTSYEAEEGCHDDLVMGLILFAWLTGQNYFKEYTDTNAIMNMRDKDSEEIAGDLSPFGYIEEKSDPISYNKKSDDLDIDEYWRGGLDDIRFLLK